MSRISIDVTDAEHKKLKALAALSGKSIKEFVIERTLGTDEADEEALRELETLLDGRIRAVEAGATSQRTATEVFEEVIHRKAD